MLTQCKDVDGLVIKLAIILAELAEAVIKGYLVGSELGQFSLCFPSRFKFFECRYCTPQSRLCFMRKALLDHIFICDDTTNIVDPLPVRRFQGKRGPRDMPCGRISMSYRHNWSK